MKNPVRTTVPGPMLNDILNILRQIGYTQVEVALEQDGLCTVRTPNYWAAVRARRRKMAEAEG